MESLLAAHEQLRSDGCFELLNPTGHARLHAMELSGGSHDTAFLCHGFEDRKIGKVHSTPS